jgi:hypothetical protein
LPLPVVPASFASARQFQAPCLPASWDLLLRPVLKHLSKTLIPQATGPASLTEPVQYCEKSTHLPREPPRTSLNLILVGVVPPGQLGSGAARGRTEAWAVLQFLSSDLTWDVALFSN